MRLYIWPETRGHAHVSSLMGQMLRRICLVACCPGGVASNVVTFLANADVPLSVCMTTVSTFAAVVVTPVLTRLLVRSCVAALVAMHCSTHSPQDAMTLIC